MQLLNNVNFLVLVQLVISVVPISDSNCDKNGVLFYEDMACTPVKRDGEICPSRFECNFNQVKRGCMFKGRTYSPNEEIDYNVTVSGCSIACRCTNVRSILCAILDCPEFLGHNPSADSNCYRRYTLGQCCSTGQSCERDTKTCEVDGEIYKIGQKFYPKTSCLSCICHEEFRGEFDDKTCFRQNCNIQLHFANEIARNCAPVYFKSNDVLCCPNDFVCPGPGDEIKALGGRIHEENDVKCVYGENKLNRGEGFMRKINKYGKDRELECKCSLPPFVTCREV